MRFAAPLLIVSALVAPARADDPPKVDLKKGVALVGRSDAPQMVEMRARVSGYLERIAVKEGEAVRKGDLLVELDSRPYQAKLATAKAQLDVATAQLKLATANYERTKLLYDKGVVTNEEVTTTAAAMDEAAARTKAAKAVVAEAEVDLAYTKLLAPIDGKVGRFFITTGNLVAADKTKIVTVTATDPMLVYFDVDERTLLALRRALGEKGTKPVIEVGLSDEDGYPHKAELGPIGHAVDPKTGSVRLRATLPNPKELIVPGQFLRVRLSVASEK
jgi:multidrug efflux system membrane fusion protein